jgi:hypothetical protein
MIGEGGAAGDDGSVLEPRAGGVVGAGAAGGVVDAGSGGDVSNSGAAPQSGAAGGVGASDGGSAGAAGAAPETSLPPCAWDSPFGPANPLPLPFNSAGINDSFWLAADGLTAYFSSRRAGGVGSFDIYVSSRSSWLAGFSPPGNLALNTIGKERQVSLSADQRLLAYQDDVSIYLSVRAALDEPFPMAQRLGPPVASDSADVDPYIQADGSTLYFSSERTGNLDLFVVQLKEGQPDGEAVPLVALNTSEREGAPLLSVDGLTLYYYRFDSAHGLLWAAHRTDAQATFDQQREVTELSSPASLWPEALSPDGCTLYFVSKNGGDYVLNEASKVR